MKETTQTNLPTFPVELYGHSLKYEIECMLKIFLPATKFVFSYETASLLRSAEQGAFLQLKQGKQFTWFFCVLRYQGKYRRCAAKLPKCTPEENKQTCEYQFSRMLFTLLQDITGIEVPWGLLTGIRPVRKAFSMMEESGESLDAVMEQLRTVYLVSPEKLSLLRKTAEVQLPLLRQTPKRSVGFYISIPFCPTRCSYCSFVSHSIAQAKHLMPEYIRLLCRELEIWGDIIQKLQVTVDTIYFGGGTPTSISAEALEQLLQTVVRVFDLSKVREFCVEAGRPDTITREKLEVLKRYGVDRISVNPQTMEDAVLQQIGRKHTSAQIAEAFQLARGTACGVCGFPVGGEPTLCGPARLRPADAGRAEEDTGDRGPARRLRAYPARGRRGRQRLPCEQLQRAELAACAAEEPAVGRNVAPRYDGGSARRRVGFRACGGR